MNRGEIWWAQIDRQERPVLVLTRQSVIDVRELVTVAEITTQGRGLAIEVPLVDEDEAGLAQTSVINTDGLYTIRRTTLRRRAGRVRAETLHSTCHAISLALGY